MQPIIDISSKITVDNTAWSADKAHTFKPFDHRVALVKEISILGDTTFLSDCEMVMTIGGKSITRSGESNAVTDLIAGLNLSFRREDKFVIEPGEELKTEFRTTSGTGTVQVMYRFTLLTPEEYEKLKKE